MQARAQALYLARHPTEILLAGPTKDEENQVTSAAISKYRASAFLPVVKWVNPASASVLYRWSLISSAYAFPALLNTNVFYTNKGSIHFPLEIVIRV